MAPRSAPNISLNHLWKCIGRQICTDSKQPKKSLLSSSPIQKCLRFLMLSKAWLDTIKGHDLLQKISDRNSSSTTIDSWRVICKHDKDHSASAWTSFTYHCCPSTCVDNTEDLSRVKQYSCICRSLHDEKEINGHKREIFHSVASSWGIHRRKVGVVIQNSPSSLIQTLEKGRQPDQMVKAASHRRIAMHSDFFSAKSTELHFYGIAGLINRNLVEYDIHGAIYRSFSFLFVFHSFAKLVQIYAICRRRWYRIMNVTVSILLLILIILPCKVHAAMILFHGMHSSRSHIGSMLPLAKA